MKENLFYKYKKRGALVLAMEDYMYSFVIGKKVVDIYAIHSIKTKKNLVKTKFFFHSFV